MAIQIGKLRQWTPPGTDEAKWFFKPVKGFNYDTLKDLFTNVKDDIDKFIGKDEQYNIFYTVAHHLEGQRTMKSWQAQDIVPFDLDGIDLERIDEYPQVVADACGFDLSKTGIVYSGNGCHILVQVKQWREREFIKEGRLGYKQLYERIMSACREAGLPITKDTTAWDYARILRCPGTVNKKMIDGQEVIKEAVLIQNNLEEQTWSIPHVERPKEKHALPQGSFPLADYKTITKECDFFKWLKDSPEEVHEPHAYAMLSIAGHFNDEGATRTELWGKFASPSINSKDLEEFTLQATTASGPRTCAGIDDIWGKCKTCPHYGKVTSPILLKGPDFIGTEFMGFSTRSISGKTMVRHYDDLVKYFKRQHHYRHIAESGDIYVFNGTHYVPFLPTQVKKYAQDNFTAPVKESERVEYLKAVEASDFTPLSFLESKPEGMINFKNGVLDIEAGTLLEHSPKYNFTTVLPFDYDPEASAPAWEKFIKDVTLDRKDLADILHEYMGYCAYGGEYRYHKALVLSGGGKNGKSTFVDVLTAIMGRSNSSNVPLTSLSRDVFAMADMHGKLVNISEEEPPSCFKETGVFKNLTGNNIVRAQRKFKNPFMMLSRAKIVITYNELPFISDKTTGMRRRLLIVPFDLDLERHPEKVNSNIKDDLAKELPGIFNFVLEGWKRLHAQGGFTDSVSVKEAVKELMEADDSFSMWYEDCILETREEKDVVKTADAYNNYVEFMQTNNERNYLGRKKFSQNLKVKGYALTVVKHSGKAFRGFRGAKLVAQHVQNF